MEKKGPITCSANVTTTIGPYVGVFLAFHCPHYFPGNEHGAPTFVAPRSVGKIIA